MADELLTFDPLQTTNVWGDRPPLVITGAANRFLGLNQITRVVTTASGGTFTMNPNSLGATASISGSASASTIQTALEATAAIVPGDVTVTGGPLGSAGTPVFIEWTGQFAQKQVFLVNNTTGTTGFSSTTTQGATPASALRMEELDLTPPAAKPQWVGGADSEWQALSEAPEYENRKITLKVRVDWGAGLTQDQAFDQVGSFVDRVRAAQNNPDGVPLQWTPAGSSRSVIFDVLSGDFTGLPISWTTDPGWFFASPVFTVDLICKPAWYDATETFSSTTTAATPVVSMEVTAGGDLPSLGRIIVTDNATQARRDVEWGYEGALTYNSATSLTLDSDSLLTSGFSGSQTTRSGSYDPNASGNNVIRASAVLTTPIAVCGTGAQSHVGTFRVWARCYFNRATQAVRLAWRAGDSSYATNSWAQPPAALDGQWAEVDLGTITIPEAVTSLQRWDGRIEAFENDPTQGTPAAVDVDYIRLIPTRDGYGRSRAAYNYQPGIAAAYDQFTGITPGTALSARAAPLGGSWATSGATTDFVAASPPGVELEQRTTTADSTFRYAILGSTNYTNVEVSVDTSLAGSVFFTSGTTTQGVIARWTDVNNHLVGRLNRTTAAHQLVLVTVIAGVPTTIARLNTSAPIIPLHRLRLVVYTSGFAVLRLEDANGSIIAQTMTSSVALATGGTLATGLPGMQDFNNTGNAITRYYDNFVVSTPSPEPIVINSGQSAQFRHDGVIRYDSGGTYVGGPPSYRGTLVRFPPGTGRLAVASRRVDLNVSTADNVTDSTSIQVGVRDRGLVVPR